MATAEDKFVFVNLAGEPHLSHRENQARLVGVDVAALREALMPKQAETAPTQLTFNLFDDLVLRLRTAYVEPFGKDGISWRGSLAGVANVRGYLSVMGLCGSDASPIVISGNVVLDGQNYSIQSAGSGRVRIQRKQPVPMCCPEPLFPSQAETEYYQDELTITGDGLAVIHVLAVYSTSAKASIEGGDTGIESMMAIAQLQTNEAFHNSHIAARVEISLQELPALRSADPEAMQKEMLGHKGGPLWNTVSQAREKAQAAIVVVLTEKIKTGVGGWTAGIAARIPEPPRYDASDLSYATFFMALIAYDTYTFAHELGHLLGGKHDRLTMPTRSNDDPKYDYVRGYIPADQSFVTIMGYDQPGIPYVPAYSAADCSWNGKALGIPMGQPDAADAAHFFRLSTQVVARYRGANAPRWEPVALELSVHPELGGAVAPSALGPYPKDGVIGVTATARTGYRFARWLLDGQDAGSHSVITVKMDKAHTLAAQFADGDVWHKVNVVPLPIDAVGMQVQLTPPGPAYLPGIDVGVQLIGSSANYVFAGWVVDGQPAGHDTFIDLRMEQDHYLEAKLENSLRLVEMLGPADGVVEAGSAPRLLMLQAKDHDVPRPGVWVTFALQDTLTGSQLDGPVRVQTNEYGQASIYLRAGYTAGTMKVTATLEGSQNDPLTWDITVAKRFISTVSQDRQDIFKGDPPIPFVVEVRELGKPVSAGTKVTFEMTGYKSGLTLTPQETETDESGKATATLTRSATTDLIGLFHIYAHTADAPLPATFSGRCISRAFKCINPSQIIMLGEVPALFVVYVSDDQAAAQGIPVHFTLVGGTTGITLETADTVTTDRDGLAKITAHAPTAIGLAKITVQVPHVIEPATFEVHVVSGTGDR